jgi:Co/Zn/Cd efflux system component
MMYGFSSHSWGASPWLTFGLGGFGILLALLLAVVIIALKGYALWHAARRSEKWWFIALLLINTVGLLELAYLYFVVGKWHKFKDNGTPSAPNTAPPTA